MAGRLPVVEGFVANPDQPLDQYRRAYYQTSVQVRGKSADIIVRVTTKITAWYTDPAGVHSGYRLLNSNGRLESDLLDQLSDEVAANTNTAPTHTPALGNGDGPQPAPAQNQATRLLSCGTTAAGETCVPKYCGRNSFCGSVKPQPAIAGVAGGTPKPGDQDLDARSRVCRKYSRIRDTRTTW